MTWPVTHAASGEHSQAMTRAASSGSPSRPAGNRGSSSARSASSIQPVSFGPGPTALTVIARWATSAASWRVNTSSAPLLAV